MALNWAMLSPDRSPVPLPDEMIIRAINSPGADVVLSIPGSSPGAPSKKHTGSGGLWLTDQRLIFVSASSSSASPGFDSVSVPLTAIVSCKFEQPLFGSNHLILDVKPVAAGGLTEGTKLEVRLKDKGLFEFVSSLDKTRERAIYMRRQSVDEEDALPSYSTPVGPSASSTPAPSEPPPGYDAPGYTP